MVLVCGISFISRSYDVGSAGPSTSNGYRPLVLPENSEVLYEKAAPIYHLVKTNGSLNLENTDEYSRLYLSETDHENSDAYARILFSEEDPSNKTPCDISSYDVFKYEFDLSFSLRHVLNCDFYTILGNTYDDRYLFRASYFDLTNSGYLVSGMLKDKMVLTSNKLERIEVDHDAHMEFICAYNREDPTNSRFQIKINDQLYYDSVFSEEPCFAGDFSGIFEIRFRFFESSYDSDLIVSNLKVTGYNY